MKKNRILLSLVVFMTVTACESVDSGIDEPVSINKLITFALYEDEGTKAPTPLTNLSSFNVSATSGAAGSETSKLSNVAFSSAGGGKFTSGVYWPETNPNYSFYASNAQMSHTASGQTVTISSIDLDVVCAYLPQASVKYKEQNKLEFKHILARVGKVEFVNTALVSDVKLIMKYSGSGTYNIRTNTWAAGEKSTKELAATDNANFWIVPGTYEVTLSYKDANGAAQTKKTSQEFAAGKVNNITAKLDGSVVVKTEEIYEAPTFTLGTISDVPAGGGDSGAPSVTAVGQRKRVKKTLADGTVKYDPDWTAVSNPDYTIQYGTTLSTLSDNCPSYHGGNLGTTAKARTKLGDIYVRVEIGDKTTDKTLEVWQQANEETLGTLSVKSFSYAPKVAAVGGEASPTVTYELPYSWTSGSSGKYTTGATLAYTTVTDNGGATLNASTGVVTWAANSGTERSETERVTVLLKGKSNTKDAASTQSGDVVDYYDAPTGLSVTCGDIPASGDTKSEGTVSGTAKQVVHYKSGATSTIDVSVTKSWSSAVSASNLGTTAKDRTKVGTLTLTYTANGKSNTASCDVYQASNYIKNNDVSLSKGTIEVGGTCTATYSGVWASGSAVTGYWSSDDSGVASVSGSSKTATVTGKGAGDTWINFNPNGDSQCYEKIYVNGPTIIKTETDTGTETQDDTWDDGYWAKINNKTSDTKSVGASSGSFSFTATAGYTHHVQPQKRSRTRNKYTWSDGSVTYGEWGSWSGWSNNGSATTTSKSGTPTLSSSASWLRTSGSYDANTNTSSRSAKITASYGGASATLTVTQDAAAPTIIKTETDTGTETQDDTWDDGYWAKINNKTSDTKSVGASSGSFSFTATAGYTHHVQPQKRSRTRNKYTWSDGSVTYSEWGSWSGWSNDGSATSTSKSATPTLSSDASWLRTNGSYDENTSTSSRTATITASYGGSSAKLEVTQAAKDQYEIVIEVEE